MVPDLSGTFFFANILKTNTLTALTSRVWKSFRAVAVVCLLIGVAIPVAVYVILSTQWAQDKIREIAQTELSKALDTEVTIGEVKLRPFNRLELGDIRINDDFGNPALTVKRLDGAFEFFRFLRTQEIIIDYALLENVEANISKASPDSKLNIAKIITKLTTKQPNKPPTKFDLRIENLVIIDGIVNYNILDQPPRGPGVFDKNHVRIYDLNLQAYAPRIKNDAFDVLLEHFSFREQSGFRLSEMCMHAVIDSTHTSVERINIKLPASELRISDIALRYPALNRFADGLKAPQSIEIQRGSRITPSDLKAFLPVLNKFPDPLSLYLDLAGNRENVKLNALQLSSLSGPNVKLNLNAKVDSPLVRDSLKYEIDRLQAEISPEFANILLSIAGKDAIYKMPGNLLLDIKGYGSLRDATVDGSLNAGPNKLIFNADASSFNPVIGDFDVEASLPALALWMPRLGIESTRFSLDGNVNLRKNAPVGKVVAEIASVTWHGHNYKDLTAFAVLDEDRRLQLNASSPAKDASFDFYAMVDLAPGDNSCHAHLSLRDINPHALNLTSKYPDYHLKGNITAELYGKNINDAEGTVELSRFTFTHEKDYNSDASYPGLDIRKLTVSGTHQGNEDRIKISSDFLNGDITGRYAVSTLPETFKLIASRVLPSLVPESVLSKRHVDHTANNFQYDFTLEKLGQFVRFFNIGLEPLKTVNITGHANGADLTADFNVDMPYLRQLKNGAIIDNSYLHIGADGEEGTASLYLTSHIPTKKGDMALTALINAGNDKIDSRFDWLMERAIPLNGRFDLAAEFGRNQNGKLTAVLDFKPGTVNFGNDSWNIAQSKIVYDGHNALIDNFMLTSGEQKLAINGAVSADPEEKLSLKLEKVHLLDIFETLEINKALIGGTATGDFEAAALLGKEPSAFCNNLSVDSISYNRCVLGNAKVKVNWNNADRAVVLDANLSQPGGYKSHIYGSIFPMDEALDISFDANHVRVGFMKPFMSAFSSDISGYASGHARLFGTFKYIDLEGDIFAEDLKLKVDFTNTYYTATDSIHLEPGLIDIKNVTVRDLEGHTAKLNGYVKHTFFKEPVFEFNVTDAVNLLSYNVGPKESPDWYGTIYGNGGATVKGWPGTVEIGVKMSTATKSVFTFVLSDRVDADDFTFISFRDKTVIEVKDSLLEVDDTPQEVLDFRNSRIQQADVPSDYKMDINVDINPNAKMIIVMDPVGGDEIKAYGAGHLRMTYSAADNDLKMYGIYTLDSGNYNFTLQDIIIKDFAIRQGSTISFNGDPYSARLGIEASYSVNANLSDLDEGFLQDKDLNRTNVPVNAILKVNGDMRQPDIDFDLEFPTLNSDIYRKVRSIVSTKEMMNRQIIYLLALNRFYTPDYLRTTKGNELFSVASSTISSQLGSMLGHLSENWSISPNLRSNRGDFSDVEVDVALSSRLLNNRLLFNGNFGYRDKSLNSNQFIGDFDIEYLLNQRGSWRLKAYNRYNDRNFYVRSAATTQGVGIMYKRDFDNMFGFFKRKKKAPAPDKASSEPPVDKSDKVTVDKITDDKNHNKLNGKD